jgi:hypothetical protein
MIDIAKFQTKTDRESTSATLAERRSMLERRLDDGYRRIEDAIASGIDVTTWESHWIELLRQYESICEELRIAA